MDDHKKTKAALIRELEELRAERDHYKLASRADAWDITQLIEKSIHLAQLGSWQLDLEKDELIFTKSFYDVYELSSKRRLNLEEALSFYIPESREKLKTAIEQLKHDGTPFDLLLKIITQTGKKRWVRSLGAREMKGPKVTRLYGVMQDVTQLEILKEKLQEQERFYKDIFDTNQAVKLIIDPESGHIVEANQAACRFYGYDRETLLSMNISDINTADKKTIQKQMAQVKTRKQLHLLFRHKRADGTMRDVEVFSGPVKLGQKVLLYSIIHDVTKREHESRLNKVLFGISQAAQSSPTLEELFQSIYIHIRSLFDTPNFYIARYHPDGDYYTFPFSRDEYDQRTDWAQKPLKKSLTDYVRRTGKPLRIEKDDYYNWVKKGKLKKVGQPAEVWIGAPFSNIPGLEGVVAVQSYQSKTTYTEDHLKTLQFVAGHIGLAIIRKEQSIRIRESEERYRLLVDQSPLAIAIHQEGKVVFVNNKTLELFGAQSKEKLIGRDVVKLIHKTQQKTASQRIQQGYAGQNLPPLTYKLNTLSGEERDVEILPAPVSFNNKPAVQVVLSDITEQNRLLSKLRDAAFSYRGLFDNAPDAIYILNTKGDFIEINKSVETLYGLSRAYYLGKNIKDLTPVKKETIKTIRNTFNKVLKGTPQKFEYQGKRRDGSVYTERLSLYLSLYFGQDVIIAYGQDITEYKKSLEELHLSEESFRGLFDNASDAIYIQDEKGRILDVNKSVEKMYGFPRDYFIGKTPLDVAAPNLNNLEQVAALFNETFSTGKSNHFEFWAVRKNGEVFPKEVRISRSLYFGQIVVLAFAQDITHRKAQEKALLASENRFRQLIESAPVGIGMVYKNKLTFTNPTFNSIFGYKDNLAGHSIEEFFTEDEHKKLQTISSALKKSAKHIQMELKGTHQDGSTIPVQLNAAVIEQEEGAAILFFITDISSLKREQEKRLELEKQVLQTQKLESLGVLAGGIAHDFNNLLTGIMGNTGLAMMEIPENTPAQNNLMKIEQIAGRAADLCNQMLAYSGRGNFVIKTVNMNTMIQDIIELINVSLSKKIQIIYDLEKDLPNNDADAQQMSQVILNLITNAADAIGSNPGIITVKTYSDFFDSAELHSSYMESVPAEGRYTVFEVRDTGKGMDQDTISKIFEPFFTTKFTGRGLGLSAVLGIIRGHKGCIQIESTPGKGSVFRVFLPVSEKEKTEAGRPAQLPGQDWKAEGRVLVADDETHILEMAEAVLQKIGYTVVTAPNGLEAVELFRQAPDSFDLIILDLTMPVLSGEEAYDHIREIAPDIPVILSSGFTDTEARIRFKDKAPAGFLQKPYTIEKLRHTLYKLSKKKAPDNT